MPAGKLNRIGVWENQKFIGVVLFGLGSGNSTRGEQYGLAKRFEVAELCRVALNVHQTPTSKIVALATKWIIKKNSKLKMLVSFADSNQGHCGTLYQACNWIYVGGKAINDTFIINGVAMHPRTVASKGSVKWARSIDPQAKSVKTLPKHKYVYPISDKAKQWALSHKKPYPKRVRSADSGTSGNQPGGGGANPTRTL
jgi:hypothetical protein